MIDVFVADEFEAAVNTETLTNAALKTLHHQGRQDEVELTLLIDADERLRELNLQFRGLDTTTDVLSFPADEFDPDTGLRYLGDIIISFPTAEAQAEAAGVSVDAELQLLVIHGVLHLLGHDHANPDEKARMWADQKAILDELGLTIQQLPEE